MIATLLSKLDGVRQNGQGKWLAICPAHADKKPSLALKVVDDGKVLLHCFAGCAVHDVVAALGISLADLFPKTANFDHSKKFSRERVISASDALRLLDYEVEKVLVIASDIDRCARTGERLPANVVPSIQRARAAIANVKRVAL
jgi:hypothetical protein